MGQACRRRALRRRRRRRLREGLLGDGATKPSQGKLSAALAPVKDRFNTAYRRALQNRDDSETDRLDTFRRDLRTFVSTYDFLAAIVDYDDVELEKRATFARLLPRRSRTQPPRGNH